MKDAHWRWNWSCSIWQERRGPISLHPLAMLELFEQLNFHGTGHITLTSPKMSTYLVTPTSKYFCQGLHIRRFFLFLPERQSVGKEGIAWSGCARCIETQWFWEALHLINLPPESKWRPNGTNWPRPATISARDSTSDAFNFLFPPERQSVGGRHFLKWLCEINSNAVVLSSAPFDKFATRVKWKHNATNWFALAIEHPLWQAQEECSLTLELDLLHLTKTPWASHACTLLPCLSCFKQLNLMAVVRWP